MSTGESLDPRGGEKAAAEIPLTAPARDVSLGPTAAADRVEAIDVLRGLSLFGILVANIRGFAAPAAVYFVPDLYWSDSFDRIAQAFVDIFVQQKFITIFAFLFGTGFAAQLSRTEARGAAFGWMYSRRLLILAAFGLVHGLFIWFGDILLMYALIGFLLFFFRRRRDATLIAWAVVGMLIPLLLIGAVTAAMAAGAPIPPMAQPEPGELRQLTAMFADGTWSQIQQQRIADAIGKNWGKLPFYGSHVLALFLLGSLAWRRGFFAPRPESLPAYRTAMIWGFAVGIPGNVAAAAIRWYFELNPIAPSPMMLAVAVLQAVAVPALSLGYVCAVLLWCRRPRSGARLAPFRAVGRTALSNYLLQSVIGTLIFYSYGLGLFGTMGPAALLLLAIPIFAVQTFLSNWWIARFRFGPAEWLWRSLTYGRLQPLRRTEGDSARAHTGPAA